MQLRLPLLPAWLRWSAVAALAGFIFYTSVVTVPPETAVDAARSSFGAEDLVELDKWRHFVAYATLGYALAYATTDWELDGRYLAAIVIGTTVVYGVGIEAWQSFLPARYFSLGDAWANALGGLLVLPWYVLRTRVTFAPLTAWLDGLGS